MEIIGPKSPCRVEVTPDVDGGVHISLRIPTCGGGVTVELTVERDCHGDWTVFLPTAAGLGRTAEGFDIENHTDHPELIAFFNGITNFSAPDIELVAHWSNA